MFVPDHLRKAAIKAGGKVQEGQRFGLLNLLRSLSKWMVNQGKVEPKRVQRANLKALRKRPEMS